MRLAAIEGGGTTWVCAIAIDNPDNIIEQIDFETKENPYDTLHLIKLWLLTKLPIDAIGIASFGPIDCKINSNTYGYITSTPKIGWYNTNVLYLLGIYDKEFKDIPYIFDTDVNAPALAEFHLHLMKQSTKQSALEQEQQQLSRQQQQASITSCAYITIGNVRSINILYRILFPPHTINYIYLFMYLSSYLSLYLIFHLFVYPYIYKSIYLSIYLYPSNNLSICSSMHV